MTTEMSVGRRWKSLQGGIYGGALFAMSLLTSTSAYAVSDRVKNACRHDYFQHCSQYMVGSDELRQCMRKVGEDLSTPCLVALVQEGEITKEDVARHNATKSATPKKSGAVADEADTRARTVTPASKKAHKTTTAKRHTKKTVKKTAKAQPGVHKTGSKTKASSVKAKASGAKAPVRKKSKKAKAAHTKTVAPGAGKTVKPAKKAAHTKAKAKTAMKKKSAGTAVKAKKTSKRKTTVKHETPPIDAGAP